MDEATYKAFQAQLKGGGVRAVSAPQLFATPHELSARMVDIADINTAHRVLEPSAGTGHLLRALPLCLEVKAVEINWNLCQALRPLYDVEHADFLEIAGNIGLFDRVVMNPPFEKGSDIKHIQTAARLLKPGGRLVALCANGPRQQTYLKPWATTWEDLPAGSFKDTGTMVNVALLTYEVEA